MISQRTRIQDFLRATAAAYAFPLVTYDKTTGDANVSDPLVETGILAINLCNEIGGSFELDANQGRRVARKRKEWNFLLWLKFNKEVLLEGFELSVLDPALRLSPTTDFVGVHLELNNTDITHPVQQSSSVGTEARLTFTATEMRR